MVRSSAFKQPFSSDVPFSYSQSGSTHDVLSSVLGGCCTGAILCSDLFVEHRIELRYEADEEQQDAILPHLLSGICVSHSDVPSCRSFACHLTPLNEVCTLLPSAYKCNQLTSNAFWLCYTSINLPVRDTHSEARE